MYVAAKEVLKFRFLMKTCGTRGPWGRDEKVAASFRKRGLPIKKTCGNSTREEKKKKQEKKKD
jgi:hypothetical protein